MKSTLDCRLYSWYWHPITNRLRGISWGRMPTQALFMNSEHLGGKGFDQHLKSANIIVIRRSPRDDVHGNLRQVLNSRLNEQLMQSSLPHMQPHIRVNIWLKVIGMRMFVFTEIDWADNLSQSYLQINGAYRWHGEWEIACMEFQTVSGAYLNHVTCDHTPVRRGIECLYTIQAQDILKEIQTRGYTRFA